MLSRLIHKLSGLVTSQPTEQANRENHSPATHAYDKVEHTLNAALTSAQKGNTAQALELLAQIPVEKVDNPDTLAMIAHARVLCGQLEEATILLESILATFDRSANLLASLGNVRRLQQRFEDAEALYQEAVSVDPRYVPVQINLASLQLHLGHIQAAEATLKQGLLIQPDDPDLLRELGGLYFQQRRWPESSAAYQKALDHAPQGDVKTRFSYGAALYQQGALTDALQVVAGIVETSPDNAAAQNLLGLINLGLNEREEAEDCFNLALHHMPDFQDAAINLARLERQRGRMQAAIVNYQLANSIGESSVEFLTELGTALYDVGRFSEAEEALKQAIDLKPSPQTHTAIGLLYLLGRGLPKDAEAEFQKAIALNPNYEDAQFNLCVAIQDQGDIEGAIACYDTLLVQYPNHPQLLWYKAHARLLAGDFTRAWDDYELRLNHELASKHNFTFPVWRGEPLAGKTLLIYSEQGLGDEIMFISCLPDIMQKAKHCVVACYPRLATLFTRSFPEATIVEWKQTDETPYRFENVPKIDLQIPIGSLPRYFRRSWDSFPHHSGYLTPDPNRVASWREKLDCMGQGLKVGISWRGGTHKSRRDIRSIPLEMWQPILAQTNCHFISLQYTDCIEELANFKAKFSMDIHHWQEAIDDYDETAALVSSLDMVITVCTSIVHLTGAVGRPAWVMVPAIPEWRYLREGNRMPWYPSVKLFRQNGLNEWESVLQQVSQALKEQAESAVQRHTEP